MICSQELRYKHLIRAYFTLHYRNSRNLFSFCLKISIFARLLNFRGYGAFGILLQQQVVYRLLLLISYHSI